MKRSLEAATVVEQVEALHNRVRERFPKRNLTTVCAELFEIAKEAQQTSEWIAQPNLYLRLGIGAIVVLVIALAAAAIDRLAAPAGQIAFTELIQVIEAGINDLVLLGAAIFFLATIENRLKRQRALRALHLLRSMSHIIDMHQLTKDPIRILGHGPATASSPQEQMTAFELTRYLDYCSEMLAFLGKIAALYVQDFDDSVALATVDEIQDLTTGLSRKVWQKIMMINAIEPLVRVKSNDK